ncbi:MAG TPA: DUF481 domain-containing protein [Polyangiaceae bacterium]|nr:DUF481 domain-containing protein [Polyangiaceae bacterium]
MTFGESAHAQVNVEPLRQQVTEHQFGARIAVTTTSYAGNTQGVIFGGSALVGGRTARNFGYLDLSGDYSKLGGIVSVAKWFAHLRHNLELGPGCWWEEYAQLESDRFRRVQLRELVGVGPRFALAHSKPFELFFGSSYMVEHTEIESSDPDPRGQGTFERWSNYIALTLKPDERILLSSVNYVQPRIDQFSDYKVLSVSGVAFTITKHLQSHIDSTARYESVTPSDVRRADLELKSSLEVVF